MHRDMHTMHRDMHTMHVVLGKFKKKQKHFDGLSPTYLKTPPCPPKMWTMFFFHHCFIVLFQYLYIFFYIKSKKNTCKVDSDRDPPPPPHCGLNPSKCFCFFLNFPYDFFRLMTLSHEASRKAKVSCLSCQLFKLWLMHQPDY